jgi:hypothetical protein
VALRLFTEGAQYGIEVFYPHGNELHVSRKNGRLVLDGDFGPRPNGDLQWPPFRTFGEDYYTCQFLLDLKVGGEWAVRTEPAPAVLYRQDRHRPDRRASAAAYGMVADNSVRRVQVSAGGTHAHLPSRRADVADPRAAGTGRFRSRPQGRRGGGGTRDARSSHSCSRPTLAAETTWVSDTHTRCSTALFAISCAPPRRGNGEGKVTAFPTRMSRSIPSFSRR